MTDNNYLSPHREGIASNSASGSATTIATSSSSNNAANNKLTAQEEVALHSHGGIQLAFRQLWIMLKRNFLLQVFILFLPPPFFFKKNKN